MIDPLPRTFYAQDARHVARGLLGAILVRQTESVTIRARIVETEAYTGLDDLASHGRAGRTPRNLPMWEAPGHAYVYLVYGRYWLLNAVCEAEGQPAAALIRALEPLDGLAAIAQNRAGRPAREYTNGPGRLTLALDITDAHNRADLTDPDGPLIILPGESVPAEAVATGPRIGMGKNVPEPWFSIARRYWLHDNPHVSRG
ncbi:MAG: DNA-3-methyladenine glycosylase [Anaerolineales bacterium]